MYYQDQGTICDDWRFPQSLSFALLIALFVSSSPTRAADEETWVTSITTSSQWAVFICNDYLITNVCGTDKDYSNTGSLPSTVSVGDTVIYVDKGNKQKQFVVRHISFLEFDKDMDFSYGGQRYTAKRGETNCSLYDAKNRSATRATEYPSKIVVKNCRRVLPPVATPMTATAQPLGPLTTISSQQYLKLTEDMQVLYIAGVLDGVTYTTYGYSLPDHDTYVRCARTMTVGVFAQRVGDWIRANPKFTEASASAVAKTMGAYCAH
jgi:hypothetical protein